MCGGRLLVNVLMERTSQLEASDREPVQQRSRHTIGWREKRFRAEKIIHTTAEKPAMWLRVGETGSGIRKQYSKYCDFNEFELLSLIDIIVCK